MDKNPFEEQLEKPRTHAERCPVCNGFGTLKYGTKECQGCGGKGWIAVPNELPEEENG